jgi:carbon monoxide dehydrogenase subunit G
MPRSTPPPASLVSVWTDMSTVHAEIEIDAPMQVVWDTVMDPQRLKDWVTIHRSVNNISERPLRRGSTLDQVLHIRGVSFHVHWTLTDVSSPKRAEWEGQGPAHSAARIRYELSGDGDGPTRFAYTNEFMTPGGKLGNIASRFIVGATSEREANNSLARLKALLERG